MSSVVPAMGRLARTAIASMALCLVACSAAADDSADVTTEPLVTVLENETLSSIAQRFFGAADYWRELADHNGIPHPDRIEVGQSLRLPQTILQQLSYVSIAHLKGEVGYVGADGGSQEPLDSRRYLYIGDTVTTGVDGFVSLVFKDSSSINVQPSSKLRLEQIDCPDRTQECRISLWLEQGDSAVRVRPRAAGESAIQFTIDTPYASAVVRGTDFDFSVRVSESGSVIRNLLSVTSGEVAVSAAGL